MCWHLPQEHTWLLIVDFICLHLHTLGDRICVGDAFWFSFVTSVLVFWCPHVLDPRMTNTYVTSKDLLCESSDAWDWVWGSHSFCAKVCVLNMFWSVLTCFDALYLTLCGVYLRRMRGILLRVLASLYNWYALGLYIIVKAKEDKYESKDMVFVPLDWFGPPCSICSYQYEFIVFTVFNWLKKRKIVCFRHCTARS